ncbi:thioredoxin domain-containing protein [Hirsutella rhossiliensis]|uniref:Thioredoxin domain-containing protein n=1 Tax=Hirsutella rhossiliensis TaxID=111463 RepID=A0A9P8N0V7_9HYPO|nr:thioredoxin domain-containing protein [Hirsutella rhossiliensis]KAH0963896.1 thioredoxin domain-containing protein [Hirsutella rhossiliensis]
MSGPINIGSTGEWQSLLSNTSIVVADFYADWCGPCKMISPHFERLSKEHSRPKKVAFAKVNVDSQSAIARTQSVSAMPTFKIFHAGQCVDTIQGANPPALAEAVTRALKLADAGGKPGAAYKTPGRTLGGASPSRGGGMGLGAWNLSGLVNMLVAFVGLYLISLFSFDARKAAESSWFNVHKKPTPQKRTSSGAAPAGPARPPQKPAFRTLADLGSE